MQHPVSIICSELMMFLL